MRNQTNKERTGQSYRDHDITPDEFMATFGVRGGQFGNWVTGDECQQMLNNAYDSFMDLSKDRNSSMYPEAVKYRRALARASNAIEGIVLSEKDKAFMDSVSLGMPKDDFKRAVLNHIYSKRKTS